MKKLIHSETLACSLALFTAFSLFFAACSKEPVYDDFVDEVGEYIPPSSEASSSIVIYLSSSSISDTTITITGFKVLTVGNKLDTAKVLGTIKAGGFPITALEFSLGTIYNDTLRDNKIDFGENGPDSISLDNKTFVNLKDPFIYCDKSYDFVVTAFVGGKTEQKTTSFSKISADLCQLSSSSGSSSSAQVWRFDAKAKDDTLTFGEVFNIPESDVTIKASETKEDGTAIYKVHVGGTGAEIQSLGVRYFDRENDAGMGEPMANFAYPEDYLQFDENGGASIELIVGFYVISVNKEYEYLVYFTHKPPEKKFNFKYWKILEKPKTETDSGE